MPAVGRQVFYRRDEIVVDERLEHHRAQAGVGDAWVAWHHSTAEDRHRDVAQLMVPTDRLAQFQPGQPGHLEVRQDHVRVFRDGRSQCGHAVRCGQDREPGAGETRSRIELTSALSSAMSTVATRTFPRVTGCLLEAILVSRTCAKTVPPP